MTADQDKIEMNEQEDEDALIKMETQMTTDTVFVL